MQYSARCFYLKSKFPTYLVPCERSALLSIGPLNQVGSTLIIYPQLLSQYADLRRPNGLSSMVETTAEHRTDGSFH